MPLGSRSSVGNAGYRARVTREPFLSAQNSSDTSVSYVPKLRSDHYGISLQPILDIQVLGRLRRAAKIQKLERPLGARLSERDRSIERCRRCGKGGKPGENTTSGLAGDFRIGSVAETEPSAALARRATSSKVDLRSNTKAEMLVKPESDVVERGGGASVNPRGSWDVCSRMIANGI